MTEQSNTSNTSNSAPLWNGWAMGMFAGLLALSGIFFGWTKTIHLDNRWAHLSSEFQATCRDQEVLAAVIDDLIEGNDGNRELRAEFRQLELRTYPAAEVDVLGIDPPTYDADSVTRVFPELVALRQYSCETPPAPHAPSVFTDEG
jgi:hypothetical protein